MTEQQTLPGIEPAPHDPLAQERAEFEQAAYRHYLQRKASGKLNPDGEGDGSLESLVWKRDDGSYGVLALNAAFWGWQAARGLV